jgi:plastocyanin
VASTLTENTIVTHNYRIITSAIAGLGFAVSALGARHHRSSAEPIPVTARLSEWKVELSEATVAPGPVAFTVANGGSIPHALEVEGQGIEQETALIQPGSSATLSLTLRPGIYEVYCPVGEDSHKKLGMETHLKVVSASNTGSPGSADIKATPAPAPVKVPVIQVTGGGPVIQILPGPFPFADSAAPILKQFGNEREGLESQAQSGPYSNNVVPIAGSFTLTAWDKGAARDSVHGVAEFTTQDHARWRLVLDRVQTKDVPHHPRFGGVIMGLYYHGMTGVHTPLVPTINSAVALWAFGHLYRNGTLVTDDAMVHVMQLSRTRRAGDFALACWDCSKNKIEELQLQVLPAPGEPKFDAPGGFLFVNWEKSGFVRR